ncbi:hypothetical protein [Paenibacillus pini]|uniref:Uncharacterized protein n=1 Tax=Paenibacillus pini JCM 16418 TaxID=1236976 RepID=W7YUI2_9BACL|nr:hypothetical protein [Paenibacillus pini]GAF10878.1 hypothetical protein JCM16418_5108 [Paenibacillus pini JCM 16418]
MTNLTIKFHKETVKEYMLPLYIKMGEYLHQIIEMNDYYYLLCMNNGSVQLGYKSTTIKEMLDALKDQDYCFVNVHIEATKNL